MNRIITIWEEKPNGNYAKFVFQGHLTEEDSKAAIEKLKKFLDANQNADGKINLITDGYVPRTGDIGKLHILGTDVQLLLSTIDYNLQQGGLTPRFQRKVSYNNLPVEALADFRSISAEKSQYLLMELDRVLSQQDRDVNPTIKGTGRKEAGIGIYYFERDVTEGDQ